MTHRLIYNYNLLSTLQRRVFVINSLINDEAEQVIEVTAPDQVYAQELVRRYNTNHATTTKFWTYAIREVTRFRDGRVSLRPFMIDGHTVKFPYFNGGIMN